MTLQRSAKPKPPKPRKCVICRTEFQKRSMSHKLCGAVACAVTFCEKSHEKSLRIAAKAERQATKLKLEATKPLGYWEKRAEKAFNAFIRRRDEGQGCISCGRHDAAIWNAGHYKSVGGNRTLRFNEDNVHLQCARPCNKDLGGNIHNYRIGLIAKIGLERVEALEVWVAPVKMTIEHVKAIEVTYKAKLKGLS